MKEILEDVAIVLFCIIVFSGSFFCLLKVLQYIAINLASII